MSNKVIFALAIIGIIGSCASCSSSHSKVKGSGNLTTWEKAAPAFEKISVSSSAEVRFHKSQEYRVVVIVDENLEDYVVVETINNVLHVRQKGERIRFTKFSIDVYAPALSGVSMSGSGRFENIDKLTAQRFESTISGSGRMYLNIECENFSGTISGSGKIEARGKSAIAEIRISGSGGFNGEEFSIKSVNVRVSGSGNTNVNVSETLTARASGSGRINYSGEPESVDSSVSGSGQIRKI